MKTVDASPSTPTEVFEASADGIYLFVFVGLQSAFTDQDGRTFSSETGTLYSPPGFNLPSQRFWAHYMVAGDKVFYNGSFGGQLAAVRLGDELSDE